MVKNREGEFVGPFNLSPARALPCAEIVNFRGHELLVCTQCGRDELAFYDFSFLTWCGTRIVIDEKGEKTIYRSDPRSLDVPGSIPWLQCESCGIAHSMPDGYNYL